MAFSNFLTNAIVLSSMYALVAIGLTLIYSVGGIFNLAHGVNVTIGAWVTYYFVQVVHTSIWVGAFAALVIPALFSLALYRGMIRTIQDEPIIVMTVTLLVQVISGYILQVVAGARPRVVPQLATGIATVAGLKLQWNLVLMIVVSWGLILGILWVIDYTTFGKAVVATSMSKKGSALMGINRSKVLAGTWIIAGVLAGIAGVFFGSYQGASWSLGQSALFTAFPIVVLGGIGSVRGSIVAAYIIGFLETGTITYINPQMSGLFPVLLLIVILLIRPQGLLGRDETGA